MSEYTRLERQYAPWWPAADTGLSPYTGSTVDVLDEALDSLYNWERKAQPMIHALEVLDAKLVETSYVQDFIANAAGDGLDFALLGNSGPDLQSRLFLMPSRTRLARIPQTVFWREYASPRFNYLLLVGATADLDALTAELALKKYTQLPLPALSAGDKTPLEQVSAQLAMLQQQESNLRVQVDQITAGSRLSHALGEITRMKWFLSYVSALPASQNFAWITGWTSDSSGEHLRRALALQGSHAILYFPPPPAAKRPPMVLENPWWAKPFEIFSDMLGTPDRDEADPSRILALMTPLLFGYMFGDVGQGLVLLLAGLLLQHRWPIMRLLVFNGAAAMVFGALFGSVFGMEGIIPALWLHPVEQPLLMLAVPLVAGVVIITTGMALNAAEYYWRGRRMQWLLTQAPLAMMYFGVISLFFIDTGISMVVLAMALTWYLVGNAMVANGQLLAVLSAIASLVENMMQLVLNTVSFVRVGAFALAHAGLSLAFESMAHATESLLAAVVIMLIGNIIVIVIEGIVVSIQTTRLVLFEFFIRFLQADGRTFRPMKGPALGAAKP